MKANDVVITTAASGGGTATASPEAPMSLDDLRQMIAQLAVAVRKKLGPQAVVLIAAGFPIDDNHDRFASYVTGSCLRSRGLVAWSQRSFESQIDESDTSIGEDGRVK